MRGATLWSYPLTEVAQWETRDFKAVYFIFLKFHNFALKCNLSVHWIHFHHRRLGLLLRISPCSDGCMQPLFAGGKEENVGNKQWRVHITQLCWIVLRLQPESFPRSLRICYWERIGASVAICFMLLAWFKNRSTKWRKHQCSTFVLHVLLSANKKLFSPILRATSKLDTKQDPRFFIHVFFSARKPSCAWNVSIPVKKKQITD